LKIAPTLSKKLFPESECISMTSGGLNNSPKNNRFQFKVILHGIHFSTG
jgi:hypothetical protein